MISIVIPAYNQVEYCRQCIQSILIHTDRPYRLILVDNGSTDGVPEYFDSVPGALVIHSERNMGFAGGVNLGIHRAEGHILLLNSDTIVPQGWLGRLERALLYAPDIGMIGPMSNCVSGSQLIEGLEFTSIAEINAFSEDLAARNAGKLRDVARLVGFCLLIRDSVVKEVGLFDEAYGIGNFEDDDYCLRTLRAGYRLCVAEDCFVFHYGGRTFLSMGIVDDQWKTLMEQNERLFQEKWQARPEERSDALQHSRQINRKAREALEKGDRAEALRLYRDAIQQAPFYEMNYNDLGVVLWQLQDHARACECFEKALRINPDFRDAQDNLRDARKYLDNH